jgi:hypothetical protein
MNREIFDGTKHLATWPVVMTKERKAEMQDEITQQIAIYLAKGLEITKLASNQRKEDANVPQQDPRKRTF